jgi:microcystin-dependent protein
MSDYYTGEIRLFVFDYAPTDFLPCDGRLLAISQYQALYALIGTTYGGDGRVTFGIPDLRGRSPVAVGKPTDSPNTYVLGQAVGAEVVTVTEAQMPAHTHVVSVATGPANSMVPSSGVVQSTVSSGDFFYCNADQAGVAQVLATQTVSTSGGAGQAHANMQPSIVLGYAICVNGLYPSSN